MADLETNEHSSDMGNKYYETIKSHLEKNDIKLALTAMRNLSQEAKSRKGLDRPMIQLLAAKALTEIHLKIADIEVKSNTKPDNYITNVYTTTPEERKEDDAIAISRRLNRGLSKSTKR